MPTKPILEGSNRRGRLIVQIGSILSGWIQNLLTTVGFAGMCFDRPVPFDFDLLRGLVLASPRDPLFAHLLLQQVPVVPPDGIRVIGIGPGEMQIQKRRVGHR